MVLTSSTPLRSGTRTFHIVQGTRGSNIWYNVCMKLPKILLHLEGFAILSLSAFAYFYLDGSIWLFVILLLAPDIGILGYATKNNKIGSYIYNAFHTYSIPIALGALAFLFEQRDILFVSLIWIAHIGMDRASGYGLKYDTHFKDTHLQRL